MTYEAKLIIAPGYDIHRISLTVIAQDKAAAEWLIFKLMGQMGYRPHEFTLKSIRETK